MKNYMMIDGKKIELSQETVDSFKAVIKCDSEVEEFISLMPREELGYMKRNPEYFMPFLATNTLYVKYPPHNAAWSLAIMKAAEEFCKGGVNRYPVFDGYSRDKHLTIRLDG